MQFLKEVIFLINVYIKELEKKEEAEISYSIPKWAKNLLLKIMIKVNWVIVKKIDENKKIYFIAKIDKQSVYKRIRKRLEKEKTQTQKLQIILSNPIKKYQTYFEGYKIVEGRTTFIASLEDILKKILQDIPLALQDVYILTNHYSEKSITIIKELAWKVKTINIITREIGKYKNLEEMMQEQGLNMCIANNKKKSLKKAKIVINIDFTNEELNQYTIFRNAILINTTREKLTNLKGFDGIIIQNMEIELEKEEKQWIEQIGLGDAFQQLEVYESLQEGKKKRKIKISSLYGNNGQINEKELRNWQKILTNTKN